MDDDGPRRRDGRVRSCDPGTGKLEPACHKLLCEVTIALIKFFNNMMHQLFYVSTSTDGVTFDEDPTLYGANTDLGSIVSNYFSQPVVARYVRITVQSWWGHISMRAAVLTCPQGNFISPNSVAKV